MPLYRTDASLARWRPARLSKVGAYARRCITSIAQSGHFSLAFQIPNDSEPAIGRSCENMSDVVIPSDSRDVVERTRARTR